MKTSKEFFEVLNSDEEFAKEVTEKVKEKIDAGMTDYKAVWIPVAAEYGYEITGEELDELYAQTTAQLSEEELGKVSGGITPSFFVISGILSAASVTGVIHSLISVGTNK